MHFTTPLLTPLLALAGLATASPVIETRQTSTVTPPSLFYLQTKVYGHHKDCGTNKTGLYVTSYHTGAGLGDATLSVNKIGLTQAYLNGSQLLFTYPDNQIGGWPLAVTSGTYQNYDLVTISIAANPMYYQGFFFNSTGLQFNQTNAGWLACDWWHGVPQLFSIESYQSGKLPKTCSKVHLLPIAI